MLNKSSLLKGKDPPVPVSFDMQIITLDLNKQAEFESLTAPGVTTRILMLENKKKVQKKSTIRVQLVSLTPKVNLHA